MKKKDYHGDMIIATTKGRAQGASDVTHTVRRAVEICKRYSPLHKPGKIKSFVREQAQNTFAQFQCQNIGTNISNRVLF